MIVRSALQLVAFSLAVAGRLAGQSALLTSLEGSVPAPVIEPTAGVFAVGLPGLWLDPTTSPHATGAYFDVYRSSYASVDLYHAALAFRLGPRWALSYGQSEIANLFDSSLTNSDPGLASLRARALWTALDATATWRRLIANLGVGWADDDNVGDEQTSTVGRMNMRLAVAPGFSLGTGVTHAIGGSIPAEAAGRFHLDAVANRSVGDVAVSVAVAATRGSVWRYSETHSGMAVAALATIDGRLDLGVGIGRYNIDFGATDVEWSRSAIASVHMRAVRVGFRYAWTELGAGSGYGISLAYEPGRLTR